MKKTLSAFILILFTPPAFAQDKTDDELRALCESNNYDKVISFAPSAKEYSAKSLYYIGFAYYMKEDDNNCLKFIDRSIAKDPKLAAPYFIKASTLNYKGKYADAIANFRSAINIKPTDARYYSGMGDAYYSWEKLDSALVAYKKATEIADCPDRPYSMIAQIYSDQKDDDKALEAFNVARFKINKKSDSYINALYNIGLFEALKGNDAPAESAYVELLALTPADYHTYAKLIQVYYHQQNYAKAKPYKDKLYAAHKAGLLKDNLADMFCFDQFKWNGKLVMAFERFQESSKDVYNKHLFYVVGENGNTEDRVQTEYSPISAELGGKKYLLCRSKGNTHFTYPISLDDNFKYDDLKKNVIDILDGKIKAGASSTMK